jgi:hypothetical protein
VRLKFYFILFHEAYPFSSHIPSIRANIYNMRIFNFITPIISLFAIVSAAGVARSSETSAALPILADLAEAKSSELQPQDRCKATADQIHSYVSLVATAGGVFFTTRSVCRIIIGTGDAERESCSRGAQAAAGSVIAAWGSAQIYKWSVGP